MQWTRGTIGQYDALEELGSPGWNFASLQGYVPSCLVIGIYMKPTLRYMKKAEQFHMPDAAQINLGVLFDSDAHGIFGEVISGFPNPYPCPQCTYLDTLINATASVVPNLRTSDIDLCSGDPRGSARNVLSLIPGTNQGPNARNNTRSSAAQSYLFTLPPTAKPNLYILVQHRATRIIWNNFQDAGQPPRPQRVAFQSQDSPAGEMMINVEREVIISSGTLGVRNVTFL